MSNPNQTTRRELIDVDGSDDEATNTGNHNVHHNIRGSTNPHRAHGNPPTAFTNRGGEVISKVGDYDDDYDDVDTSLVIPPPGTFAPSVTLATSTELQEDAYNRYGGRPIGSAGSARSAGSVPTTTTSTSASASAAVASIPDVNARFRLPNGEIMNSKNTLQSFDDHVAVRTSQQRYERHMAAMAAAGAPPSTMKPPATSAAPVGNVPPSHTHRNNGSNGDLGVVHASTSRSNHNPTIQAQAVPVHSVIVAEGELFDPVMYAASSPPPKPTATAPLRTTNNTSTEENVNSTTSTTATAANQKGLTFWLLMAMVVILVGVVAGIAGYCGAGNCGNNGSMEVVPPIAPTPPTGTPPVTIAPSVSTDAPTVDPTMVPTRAPVTAATISQQQQLTVACNFLGLTNVTTCQATTSFIGSTVGNTIPTEIGSLTQLTYLDLDGNQLTGPIPSTLGSLTLLDGLGLSSNQLTGPIPSTLGSLTLLTTLQLWENQLTSPIPSTLGSLTLLDGLGLADNQLTGPIPSTLGSLTRLTTLELFNNTQLTGTIPSTLCSDSGGIRIFIDCVNVICTCCLDGSTAFTAQSACPST